MQTGLESSDDRLPAPASRRALARRYRAAGALHWTPRRLSGKHPEESDRRGPGYPYGNWRRSMGDRSERSPDVRESPDAGRLPAKASGRKLRMMQHTRSVALRQFDNQ